MSSISKFASGSCYYPAYPVATDHTYYNYAPHDLYTGVPDFNNATFSNMIPQDRSMRSPNALRADLKETADTFVLRVEVPGVKKEDIKLSFDQEGKTLTITSEHNDSVGPQPAQGAEGRWLWSQRCYGYQARTIRIPDAVDTGKMQAVLDLGVLRLTFNKAAGKAQRPIQIQ